MSENALHAVYAICIAAPFCVLFWSMSRSL